MRFKTAPEPAILWFLGPKSCRLRVGVWGSRVLGLGRLGFLGSGSRGVGVGV